MKILLEQLKTATSEKDVENAYRTCISSVWKDAKFSSPHKTDGFVEYNNARLLLEVKHDLDFDKRSDICKVVAQSLMYMKKFESNGEALPNVVLIGDVNECFVVNVNTISEFLKLNVDWGATPSSPPQELVKELIMRLQLPYVFKVKGKFNFKNVLDKIESFASGSNLLVEITDSNMEKVFEEFDTKIFDKKTNLTNQEKVDCFLGCLFNPDDYYLHPKKKNILVAPGSKEFSIKGDKFESFFNYFKAGCYTPTQINEFYSKKDRILEDTTRRYQGAFYTPKIWVDHAHTYIEETLGENWKEECVVWDNSCGTANLTRDYHFNDLILTTLEQGDIDIIKNQGYNSNALIMQMDFLNDDIPDEIDKKLKEVAESGKRLVFFMNPPYATDGGFGKKAKKGVSNNTKVNNEMVENDFGVASKQLYVQFLYRCIKIKKLYNISNFNICTYSKTAFVSSVSQHKFRDYYYSNMSYKSGFFFCANNFQNLSDKWGVLLSIWKNGKNLNTNLDVDISEIKNFKVQTKNKKTLYTTDKDNNLANWVNSEIDKKINIEKINLPQLTSGLNVVNRHTRKYNPNNLGMYCAKDNNLSNSLLQVCLFSLPPSDSGWRHSEIFIQNFEKVISAFCARKLSIVNWTNDKDEYLIPNDQHSDYNQWLNDCHIYSLIHSANNCTALRNIDYDNKSYNIKNHFFWKTIDECEQLYNQPHTQELYKDLSTQKHLGDPYFATQLKTITLSPDAQKVLDMLNALFEKSLEMRETFSDDYPEYHLNTWDAGVYQLKKLWNEYYKDDYKALMVEYKKLEERLRPGVYKFGFLKE